MGVYQGDFGTVSSYNQVHVFVENNWDGCLYESLDFGPPPAANYPYYVSYDGVRVPVSLAA